MDQKLTARQVAVAACMLFSIFFGAGNMIFPPQLAQLAGRQTPLALLGFIATDVGLAVLGVVAVTLSGQTMQDLAGRAGKRLAVLLTAAVYLLIGPLFALPRTGSVSFELAVVPFLPEGIGPTVPTLIYSAVFFSAAYFLSLNPSRIVDVVGKVMAPFLLLTIFLILVAALRSPMGPMGEPAGAYATMPFAKGMAEGYLALDGFAGLVFAITLTGSFREMGLTQRRALRRYTLLVGASAAALLIVVYAALAVVGAQTSTMPAFSNGGALLAYAVQMLFGKLGNLVLAVAVGLACLSTAVGLTTSFGDYFASLFPRLSYRAVILGVCFFSFLLANLGLSLLMEVVLPLLMALYPAVTVLVILSLWGDRLKRLPAVYWLGMGAALAVGVFDGLHAAGLHMGPLSDRVLALPLADWGVGWLTPALAGVLLGLSPLGRLLDKGRPAAS